MCEGGQNKCVRTERNVMEMMMETMGRITLDLSRVMKKFEEPMNAGERYTVYREVKTLADILTRNAEAGMDEAGREDPAGIAKIRKQQCFLPHC